jgi:hypothetical protein
LKETSSSRVCYESRVLRRGRAHCCRLTLLPATVARTSLAVVLTATLALLPSCGSNKSEWSPSAAPRGESFLLGRWSGELKQSQLPPFRVMAEIRSLSRSARNSVAYTGINCGGRWTYLGRRGDTYRFRETIDRGRGGKCKGVGEVSLRREGGRLRFTFKGGGVESRGVLLRRP